MVKEEVLNNNEDRVKRSFPVSELFDLFDFFFEEELFF